jgi:hypothetical protein
MHFVALKPIVILIVIGLIVYGLKAVSRGSPGRSRYRPRRLLTENEVEFHGLLRTALPDFEILAQVAMGALVEPDDRTHDARRDAERDRILESAGYRVLRWDSRDKPTLAQIAAAIGDIAAP